VVTRFKIMSWPHYLALALSMVPFTSALEINGREVTFSLAAKQAKMVELQAQWSKASLLMNRDADGKWSLSLKDVPAGVWEYSFRADGVNVIDSSNPAIKPQREPAKSILHIPSTPPAHWDWQDIPHGTVHIHQYQSPATQSQREAWVYTPPGYETSKEQLYPVLVLQHGSGDNQQAWVTHGKAHWIMDSLIYQKQAKPMVVLMLDGHPLGKLNRDDPRRGQAMEVLKQELTQTALPLLHASYRVHKDPAHSAITGLSMGGQQSITLGLQLLDQFSQIGSFSGAANPEQIQAALKDPQGVNQRLKLFWIACGKDDFLLKMNHDLVAQLKQSGINHQWIETDGDHSWPVWRQYLTQFAPLLFR
jgi:enterochelin esterase-like enzyme